MAKKKRRVKARPAPRPVVEIWDGPDAPIEGAITYAEAVARLRAKVGVGRLLVSEKRDLVDEWGDIDDPDITCTRWEKPAWLE